MRTTILLLIIFLWGCGKPQVVQRAATEATTDTSTRCDFIDQFDQNKDGAVSIGEEMQGIPGANELTKFDSNHNGLIENSECPLGAGPQLTDPSPNGTQCQFLADFKDYDSDASKTLSRQELMNAVNDQKLPSEIVTLLQANGALDDGEFSADECDLLPPPPQK